MTARLEAIDVAPAYKVGDRSTPFVLADAKGMFRAHGIKRVMPACSRQSLPGRASQFLGNAVERNEQAILVGVLPYDHRRSAYLFQPSVAEWLPFEAPSVDPFHEPAITIAIRILAEPSRDGYAKSVSRALDLIRNDHAELRKVVLARTLVLHSHELLDAHDVFERLRNDRSVTAFSVALPPGVDGLTRTFVGATPELLVEKSGSQVFSRPLAGSARRRASASEDEAAGKDLLNSAKDLREHAVVVESIGDVLAPYCKELRIPRTPSLVSTASMWHLGTFIEGTLKSEHVSSLELATALHPTPAVCGTPLERAREVISELETFDRGYFAGAVGTCDHRGDGRWFVSIRCAEISGPRARLYAGAGIVAGSDPNAEVAETAAKFSAMLRALRISNERV